MRPLDVKIQYLVVTCTGSYDWEDQQVNAYQSIEAARTAFIKAKEDNGEAYLCQVMEQ